MFTGNYRVIRGGFLQYLQGKPATSAGISLQSVNITGFSLQILQKPPSNHPVILHKHLQCTFYRDGDISWTMTSRGHFFSKWATSRGHCQRVTSRGHFCPREVLFLGEFLWTFFW